MAIRRRLENRFAFASHADRHHLLGRQPILELIEGRALLATFTVDSGGFEGESAARPVKTGTSSSPVSPRKGR
jgi:hypothetical protein